MIGDQIVAIALAKQLQKEVASESQDVESLKSNYSSLRNTYLTLEGQFDDLYALVKKHHPDFPIYTEFGYLLTTEEDIPIEYDAGGA